MDIGISVIRRGIPVASQVVTGLRDRESFEVPAGEELTVAPGDIVRVTVSFEYIGGGTVTLYGAIGARQAILGFIEQCPGEAEVFLPRAAVMTPFTASVDIPVREIAAGTYDLYVKFLGVPEAGSPEMANVITIGAAPTKDLVQHTVYPFAYVYNGAQEYTVATFRTDPFVPSAWLAEKFASKLEEEVRAKGGRPLEIKVYVDTSPVLWTNFRIEVSSTPIDGVTEGIGVGIALWLAILIVCLAITAVIIVATLAFKTILATFKTKPGLDDVKPTWGKETLILTIRDSEEYWERTPTPVETLQGMSEGDLRHLLNEIAEEEVPSGVEWAAVAVAGVVAAGVVLAAMSFAGGGREP